MKKTLIFALIFAPSIAGAVLELPPRPSGPIADLANVIDDAVEAALDAELRAYYEQTGNSVVVATVPTLQGEVASVYATKLFAAWGIGDAAKDTGVLLLVSPFGAPGERDVRIEVGYGLEGDLPDAEVSWIVNRTLLPAYQAGDVSGGTVAGAREIVRAIGDVSYAPAGNGGVLAQSIFTTGQPFFLALVFIFLNLIARFLSKSKSWWQGGVVGAVFGALVAWRLALGIGFLAAGALGVFALFGLALDYALSKAGPGIFRGGRGGGFLGGGGFGGGGGGSSFGGFGGGSSGGGGGGGRW